MTHTAATHTHAAPDPPANPQTFNSPWASEALTQRVFALWSNHSSTQIRGVIGKEFGVHLTRNQIVGKVARAGLTSEHKTELEPRTVRAKRSNTPAKPKPNRPKLHIVATGSRTAFRVMQSFETDQFEAREALVEPLYCSLDDRPDNGCCYPYGGYGEPITFCGNPKREKSSYCGPHHRLINVPPQPRKIGGWR